MRILGLDTSTASTGYAVLDDDKLICYGVIKPPKNYELLDRIIYIEKEIKEIVKKKEVEYVVLEEVALMRGFKTAQALNGLLYHLLVEFQKKQILAITCVPTQWRHTCGIKGKKREEFKKNSIEYIKNKYKIDVGDDEADAICIAEYGSTLEVE